MKIRALNLQDEKEIQQWNDFVYRRSQLYQHSHWARIISSSYGFIPYFLYIEEEGEIKSVFPLFHVKLPFSKDELVSIPHLESGGMINTAFYPQYFDYIRQNIKSKKIKIYQFQEKIGDFFANIQDSIMIKALPVEKGLIIPDIKTATIRNYMRRSLEKNLEVTIENNDDILPQFYMMYLQKMREFGTPPHNFIFMKRILEEYRENARILLVKNSKKVIGAAFYIIFNDYLYNLYLVIPQIYLKEKVGYFVEYKAMEMGIENNLKYLVLGRSTKGSGTYFYKSALGGDPVQLYLYNFTLTTDGYKAQQEKTIKEKYKLASRLWSRLPSVFTDAIGPKLRKWVY